MPTIFIGGQLQIIKVCRGSARWWGSMVGLHQSLSGLWVTDTLQTFFGMRARLLRHNLRISTGCALKTHGSVLVCWLHEAARVPYAQRAGAVSS